jgi:hypothetical protein
MARNYDSTDLVWTSRGDIAIGHNGDIADTFSDPLRSLYQEIRTRIMSEIGDWVIYPEIGASISDFVGEPNTKVTAESVKNRIQSALAKNGLINNSDMNILYMPIDIDKLLVRLSVKVAPTARNAGSETLTINFIYEYSENNVYFSA